MGLLLLTITFCSFLCTQSSIIEFDHLVINSNNLKESKIKLEKLHGFTVKARKAHKNGIRNILIEFKNDYEIELINSIDSSDELSRFYYNRQLEYSEGSPAFISFRINTAAEMKRLKMLFKKKKISYDTLTNTYSQIIAFKENYNGLFFIHYNFSYQFKSTKYQHQNKVKQLKQIFINRKFKPLFQILNINIDGLTDRFKLSGVEFVFMLMENDFPFNRVVMYSSYIKGSFEEHNVSFTYE